jgi:hypothetical protein
MSVSCKDGGSTSRGRGLNEKMGDGGGLEIWRGGMEEGLVWVGLGWIVVYTVSELRRRIRWDEVCSGWMDGVAFRGNNV